MRGERSIGWSEGEGEREEREKGGVSKGSKKLNLYFGKVFFSVSM